MAAPLALAQTPPTPLVYMPFNDGPGIIGSLTTNLGTLSGSATLTNDGWSGLNTNLSIPDTNYPAFTTNVPVGLCAPTGGLYSVDMGLPAGVVTAGNYGRAVDLVSGTGDGTVGSGAGVSYYPGLTICAWVNCRSIYHRQVVAYALTAPDDYGVLHGFDFSIDSLGDLELGINGDADSDGPWSDPVVTVDANQSTNNWRFIAVTYQPDAVFTNGGVAAFYAGSANQLAQNAGLYGPNPGASVKPYIGSSFILGTNTVIDTGLLAVGDFNANNALREAMGPHGSYQFNGWIRDLRVYPSAFTLDQVQSAQLNASVPHIPPTIIQQPLSVTNLDGQNTTFTVGASGAGTVTYQWYTSMNGGATWTSAAGATAPSFTLASVLNLSGEQARCAVSNSWGGLYSSAVTLTVLPSNPRFLALSFTEGSVTDPMAGPHTNADNLITTVNAGYVGGPGTFIQNGALNNGGPEASGNAANTFVNNTDFSAGAYPCFSPNVPVGPWAPDPRFNKYSLNMGDILMDDTGTNALPGQGGRYVFLTNNTINPPNTLGGMNGFTVSGWINSGNLQFVTGHTYGNQIINCEQVDSGAGFALVLLADGTMQTVVNNWNNTRTTTRSSPNIIVGNTNHPNSNWVFFAVTYDGTLGSANLNYYWGGPDDAATNDVLNPLSYGRGVITAPTGAAAIGNWNLENSGGNTFSDGLGTNAAFCRGLLDEIQVFTRVLSLDEIPPGAGCPG